MHGDLLITNIGHLVTMNATRKIPRDAWLVARGGFVEAVGTGTPPPATNGLPAHDAHGGIATPGLISTRHHFYQTMARAYTPGNNLPLLPWLAHMNRLWQPFTADDLHLCSKKMMLTGCTTAADHHYVVPRGSGFRRWSCSGWLPAAGPAPPRRRRRKSRSTTRWPASRYVTNALLPTDAAAPAASDAPPVKLRVGMPWVLNVMYLNSQPAWRAALREELAPWDGKSFRGMSQFPRLKATIQEVQRLRPGSIVLPRTAAVDMEFKGCRIPAGAPVVHANTLCHFLGEIYADPFRLKPDRWLDGKTYPANADGFFGGTRTSASG